jgi:hypothetical protein
MDTVGFGAPVQFGSHHFYVEIPSSPKDAIRIYEDMGISEDKFGKTREDCRVSLERELWTQIREEARRDFNSRLKAKKVSTGSWITGKIKMDRFLGRELCVLAWAVEHAKVEECTIIVQKWLALRPEERWWLFAKTAAEAGLEEDKERGWRKALYLALSDGEGIKLSPAKPKKTTAKKKSHKQEDSILLPELFSEN